MSGTSSIVFRNGLEVLFDASDAALIEQFKWTYDRNRGTYYARLSRTIDQPRATRMHRLILQAGSHELVDHRNGNGLDNRRSNLRLATLSQNQMNRAKRAHASSAYKGVSWDRARSLWIAYIRKDGKRALLGGFEDEVEAAVAYNVAAIQLFGEFARLNPVPGWATFNNEGGITYV